jgi:pyrimidine-nucleoside phosphorylase
MKSIPKAKYLGEMMKKIGQKFGVKTEVVYTSMNQPLGRFAGNWCEVKESVACLQGHGPKDTMKVVFETCSVLLMQSGISTNKKKSIELIENTIHSGTAMEKWLELVSTQGGDATIFDRLDRQNIPKYSSELVAKSSGFVSVMNTLGIGNAGIPLGIGRAKKNEPVDPTAGMEFLAKIGEPAKSNQPLIRLFNSNQKKLEEAQSMLQDTVLITEEKPNPHCLILGET